MSPGVMNLAITPAIKRIRMVQITLIGGRLRPELTPVMIGGSALSAASGVDSESVGVFIFLRVVRIRNRRAH